MDSTRIETLLKTRAKLRQLQILVTLGQTNNVVKAAEILNMAQPVVSRCVAQFERMLDAKLFERLPRGMAPTPVGAALIEGAEAILTELRKLGTNISELKSGEVGRLVIGFLPIGSAGPFPLAIGRFVKDRPKLELTMVEGLYLDLLPLLRSGQIDMVFGRLHDTVHLSGLKREVVYHHPWVLFAREGHSLSRGRMRTLEDLKDQSWILPVRESPARALIAGFFRRNGLSEPRHAVECSALMMARSIMLNSDRIMFAPKGTWAAGSRDGGIAELKVDFGESGEPVGLLSLNSRRSGTHEKAFRTLLQEEAGKWLKTIRP